MINKWIYEKCLKKITYGLGSFINKHGLDEKNTVPESLEETRIKFADLDNFFFHNNNNNNSN